MTHLTLFPSERPHMRWSYGSFYVVADGYCGWLKSLELSEEVSWNDWPKGRKADLPRRTTVSCRGILSDGSLGMVHTGLGLRTRRVPMLLLSNVCSRRSAA